jgi:hypothetical protein
MSPTDPTSERRSGGRVLLRIEAHPRSYRRLDSSQRRAFEACVQRLDAARDHLDGGASYSKDRPDPRVGIRLDDERRAEILFLSAERGMGKTTLMLSLMRATTSSPDKKEAFSSAGVPDLAEMLDRLRGRVVWLQPLEMDTLPRQTNLMAAILARIEEGIERLGLRPVSPELPEQVDARGDDLFDERDDVMLDLRRFQADVAIGWDGNLEARSGSMDADPYATEVLRREKGKLKLRDRFAGLLERLSERTVARAVKSPLFVLPVDDFDLNPSRCAELLRLLHLLSSPRLVSFILGDVRVAETMLDLSVSRDFSQALGSPLTDPRSREEIRSMTGEIAANTMRKLIPPAHRIEVRSMNVDEALRYVPEKSDDPDRKDQLRDLLGRIALRLENLEKATGPQSWLRDKISLGDNLLTPGVPVSATSLGHTIHVPKTFSYQGLDVLDGPPRRIADLWLILKTVDEAEPTTPKALVDAFAQQELAGLNKDDPKGLSNARTVVATLTERLRRKRELFVDLLVDGVKRMIAEEPWLRADDRQALLDMFRRRTSSREWEMESGSIEITWTGPRIVINDEDRALGVRVEKRRLFRIKSRQGARDRSAGAPKLGTKNDGGRKLFDGALSPATTGALAIIHDIFSITAAGSVIGRSLVPRQLETAWARWPGRSSSPAIIYWPSPQLLSFWGMDLVLSAWEAAVAAALKKPSAGIEYLAYCWIRLITIAVTDTTPLTAVPNPSDRLPWEELVRETSALAKDGLKPDDKRTDWLVNLACLLAPECALSESVATHFLQDKNLQRAWSDREIARRVRRERAERAAHLISRGADESAVRLVLPAYFMDAVRARLSEARPGPRRLPKALVGSLRQLIGRGRATTSDRELRRDLEEAERLLSVAEIGLEHPINKFARGALCPKENDVREFRRRLNRDEHDLRLFWPLDPK